MALVEHCGFDVTGLHVEQGMLWGCGTTEPKPRPTVATEVVFFAMWILQCLYGSCSRVGLVFEPIGSMMSSLSPHRFPKLGDSPTLVAEIGHRLPEWVGWGGRCRK